MTYVVKSTYKKELKNRERQLKVFLWENLPGLNFHGILWKFEQANSKDQNRTKQLRGSTGFLTILGNTWQGVKQNSESKFCRAEDESLKNLTSNCTTITKISVNHLEKRV